MRPAYLALLFCLLLAACSNDEEATPPTAQADPVSDAAQALVAMFSGDAAYIRYFCPEMRETLQATLAAAGGLSGSRTYAADCTLQSETAVQCQVTFALAGGVSTPVGTYTIALKDQQLCGVPVAVTAP